MDREELLQIAKPILFNTEMVRAILEGRKTVTRRCVKAKSKNACGFYVTFRKSDNAFMCVYDYDENERQFDSPQTQPAYVGDILYVRETWERFDCCGCEGDEHGNCPKEPKKSVLDKSYGCYMYRATDEISGDAKWHPSIHMPREAARIFLKVKDVRVERLQDMDWRDALDECVNTQFPRTETGEYIFDENPIDDFIDLWNSTIKKSDIDIYGWDANPWVWVIEFERIEV